jgi:transcriptional/translational regulatory protein YebC/TACO1
LITDQLQAAKSCRKKKAHDPHQRLELEPEETLQVMRVIEALEDLDDVQSVYSNLRFG